MIAGPEDITTASWYARPGGQPAGPQDRDAMVFQSYALYPHMTVRDNMALGSSWAHIDWPRSSRRSTTQPSCWSHRAARSASRCNLSGGQRCWSPWSNDRRAAGGVPDGRAAVQPGRQAACRCGPPWPDSRTSWAPPPPMPLTHDQTEAMTLGDRSAVRAGVVQQAPRGAVPAAAQPFVAGFIGHRAMNFLPGTLEDATCALPWATSCRRPRCAPRSSGPAPAAT